MATHDDATPTTVADSLAVVLAAIEAGELVCPAATRHRKAQCSHSMPGRVNLRPVRPSVASGARRPRPVPRCALAARRLSLVAIWWNVQVVGPMKVANGIDSHEALKALADQRGSVPVKDILLHGVTFEDVVRCMKLIHVQLRSPSFPDLDIVERGDHPAQD